MMPIETYQARIGERTFDIELNADHLLVNGKPIPFSFESLSTTTFSLVLDGRSMPVVIEPQPSGLLRVTISGRTSDVQVKDATALLLERFGLTAGEGAADREVRAPMPGLVLRVNVQAGQSVKKGEGLLVLEAMKMENEIKAPIDGTIAAVHVAAGEAVGKNTMLIEFEE